MQNCNMTGRVVRVVDTLIRLSAWVATIALILIMTGICLEVVARYGFSSSIHGMHAIVEGLLLPTAIFLGAPLVGRMDGHMKVEILDLSSRPRLRAARKTIFAVLISVFWLVCGWQAALRAHEAYVLKQWPIGEIAAPIVFCFGITALGCLLAACAHLLPGGNKDEAKPAESTATHNH
ncbi:MAG: TRAP transporter small permease subunit [Pusillimonas sp.]